MNIYIYIYKYCRAKMHLYDKIKTSITKKNKKTKFNK